MARAFLSAATSMLRGRPPTRPRCLAASRGPLTQHITLELGQQGEDAEDELAGGRGRIDNVLGERLQLHVLLPADTATALLAMRGDASASARVFPITERQINYILKAIVERAKGNPGTSPHWPRHAHASHAIDNGATITLVSQTLGHADLKTTSVYAHARPNEVSRCFTPWRRL